MTETSSAERRFTVLQRIQLTLVSLVVPTIIRLIGCTLRPTITFEEGSIQSVDEIYPGIFPFWHRCVVPACWMFRKRGIGVMTSQSLDGEMIARVIRAFGFVAVRGSSSRGGQRALLEMNRMLGQAQAVAFTIDGPRGPRYVAKKGPVVLSRMSGVAITAFYIAVERAWTLRSWDRMLIPKPFSRTYTRVARNIGVPPDADEAALERLHSEMQVALKRITAYAESQFGRIAE